MKTLAKFAIAWLLMWAISYIAVAIVSPNIGENNTALNICLYMFMGTAILTTTLFYTFTATPTAYFKMPEVKHKLLIKHRYACILLVFLAVLEIRGGVASWTGATIWNVPFPNKELFQVSMAFADLISAVFMLYLALDDDN